MPLPGGDSIPASAGDGPVAGKPKKFLHTLETKTGFSRFLFATAEVAPGA